MAQDEENALRLGVPRPESPRNSPRGPVDAPAERMTRGFAYSASGRRG